ncbi:hypothetical protein IG197_05975 [Aminobacter sp. SR38]|jgi:hypothetical protein|uniref:hypothetical protein n=1 Tax=Aminobacter sp. SR38 TaxID=2774562 RepID=UPI001784DB22|nr:hypothetical protein [Aminobacter sp. SR38]QOF72618.1 hypothetical protein IG197_05975 [Aminobacter sp. SR38]
MVSQKKRPARATATVTQRPWRRKVYDGAVSVDRFIETNPFIRLLGLAGALFGFVVLVLTGLQIREDFASRQEERVARAWETIYRPIPGNTGKGPAINAIHRTGATLQGLDLSCKQMKGWFEGRTYCEIPPIIADLDLAPIGSTEMLPLCGWNLSGTTITNSTIRAALISGDMTSTKIIDSTFEAVEFQSNLAGASFDNVDLTNSTIELTCNLAGMSGNLSGLKINDFESCASDQNLPSTTIWAWANNPPSLRKLDDLEFKPIPGFVYCDSAKPKNDRTRNSEWGQVCHRISEQEARKRYPREWQHAMGSN